MQFIYILKRIFQIFKNEGPLILIKKIFTASKNKGKIDLDDLINDCPKNLDEIFIKFGTDKGSFDGKKTFEFVYRKMKDNPYKNYLDWINRKDIKKHQYQLGLNSAPIYENIFSKRRNERLKILELGVANGHSIASWHHYFPNSKIYGIDIKKPHKFFYKSNRVKYNQIDIFDKYKIQKFINENGPFDYVIDDSMNSKASMLKNFENFFLNIRENGAYILEDTGFYDLVQNAYKEIEQFNKDHNAQYFMDSRTINEIFISIKNRQINIDENIDNEFLKKASPLIKKLEFGKYKHPYAGMIIIYKQ